MLCDKLCQHVVGCGVYIAIRSNGSLEGFIALSVYFLGFRVYITNGQTAQRANPSTIFTWFQSLGKILGGTQAG